jgi:FkbM family methyltransferase
MSTHTRGRCFARRGRRGGAVVAETPVTVTTLDEYCAANGIERIDLLKNDTQGYELEVLRGAEV